MPKLTRNFLKGRMNKDVDVRLVPPGEYRDAENIQISTSEGADVGTVQSVLGNTKKQEKSSGVSWSNNYGAGSTPTVIGNVRDTQNNKIYFFITSNIDAIIEYDKVTGYIAPIIIDARTTGAVLNFSANNIITGANIVDGMLFWTDDLNEPRVINITDFKAATAATVGTDTTFAGNTTEIYGTGRLFTASDITVIKQNPKMPLAVVALSTKLTASLTNLGDFGYGVRPVKLQANLTNSGGFPLSEGDTYAIKSFTEGNLTPKNTFLNKKVKLISHSYKSDGTKIFYEATGTLTGLTDDEVPGQAYGGTLTIINVSQNIPAATALEWEMTVIEDEPIFKNDFPRFSYRWKYKNGEYSTYAPFSKPAFVPARFEYEYNEGFNLGVDNNIRKITLNWPNDTYAEPLKNVDEIEVLYKGVNSNNVYVIHTHKQSSGDLTTLDIESDSLGAVVEESQLLRLWDNVPKKAKSQEIIGNRVIYGNYAQGYAIPEIPVVTAATTATSLSNTQKYYGQESVKTNRKYQVGISLLDENGRESPIFSDNNASINIETENADKINKITATTALSTIPAWASYFKYYIKDPSAEYYNLGLDRYYDVGDGNVWLSFPSSERNKITEGDYISLKKEHGGNTPVLIGNKYKILDIKNEAPDAIKTTTLGVSRALIAITSSGSLITGKEIEFDGPDPNFDGGKFVSSLEQGNFIQFRTTNAEKTSGLYKIISGGNRGNPGSSSVDHEYNITIEEEGFRADDSWLNLLTSGNIEIIIHARNNKLLPEFAGKFFAKVTKASSFEKHIVKSSEQDVSEVLYASEVLNDIPLLYNSWDSGMETLITFDIDDDVNHAPDLLNSTDATFDLFIYTQKTENNTTTSRRLTSTDAWSVWGEISSVGTKIRFKDTDGNKSDIYTITSVGTPVQVTINKTVTQNDTWVHTFFKNTFTLDRNPGTEFGASFLTTAPPIIEVVSVDYPSKVAVENPAIFETQPIDLADLNIYYEATRAIPITSANLAAAIELDFINCYSFGNGVESSRIRDDFNSAQIGKGVRVSTVLQGPYEEEIKSSGLIFGGIINSTSGINNSNQFIAAEKITKDLNPIYGSIQKLSARGAGARGDLLVLCEDKVFKILANKDALFNADGSANLTASTNVLGQAIPFAGEYGISKNPESFASYGFRAYFADKARRAVLRLSADGLTVISDKGMRDFFSDNWDSYDGKLYAAFDERNEVYSIITDTDEQASFNETVNGWPTRLTYSPDFSGVSLDNEYFTFKNGYIYIHNKSNKNVFYGGSPADSSINVIFNDAPNKAKTFKALSYDGVAGWSASITAKPSNQTGGVTDWVEKEGFYYNYIKGTGTSNNKDFNVQGIGQTNANISAGNPITFANPININVQVGDVIYKENSLTAATVSAIAADRLSITPSVSLTANSGDFFHVVKPTSLFTNSVIGNAVLVNMTKSGGGTGNNELFSVSAEVFISSE